MKGFGFCGFAWGAVLALGFTPSLHTLQHSDSGLAADVGDAGNIECGDGDGVALVAAKAVGGFADDAVEQADVVSAGAGHDDGVALLPGLGFGDIDGLAPLCPAGGAVVLRRAACGGLDAEVATETTAPGGFAVVTIQPGGGLFDPAANLGVAAAAFNF